MDCFVATLLAMTGKNAPQWRGGCDDKGGGEKFYYTR